MPKMKTHKSASRCFHITGSGKLMRTKVGKSHLRRKKASRTKRLFDTTIPVNPCDVKRIMRLLPYGVK